MRSEPSANHKDHSTQTDSPPGLLPSLQFGIGVVTDLVSERASEAPFVRARDAGHGLASVSR